MRYLIDNQPADALIADIAEAQWGVVTAAQLIDAGLSKAGITRRLRACRLHRIHRGVYAVGHRALANEGRWMAAVLAAGERAALSHRAAGALWRILPVPPLLAAIDVTTPSTGGRMLRPGLRIHRSLTFQPEDAWTRRNIPVASPLRTLQDLKPVVPAWQFHRAVNQAEVDGLLTRAELDLLFPGVADGTRSENERRFLNLCRRHGISPLPLINVVAGGRLVDAYFPAENLAIEIDSVRYHRTDTGFHRDRRRGNDVVLAGVRLLRFTDLQLWTDPAYVAATVRTARKAARLGE